MKRVSPFLPLLLLCGTLLHAQDKAVLKEISSVFEEIEKNHEAWPHRSYAGENLEGGHAFEHHVWSADDDSALIRIESEDFDDHGQSKTQYFIRGDELLFVLELTETTPMRPKAPTTVEEKRLYFSGATLIRLATKEARFAAGEPTDTAGVQNKIVPLEQVESPGAMYDQYNQPPRPSSPRPPALKTTRRQAPPPPPRPAPSRARAGASSRARAPMMTNSPSPGASRARPRLRARPTRMATLPPKLARTNSSTMW